MRYCEGFKRRNSEDAGTYRQAIAKFRRNSADPSEPSVVEITLAPNPVTDSGEKEVRIRRLWFFNGKNEPKPGPDFEQVEVYLDEKLQKPGDKDPLEAAHEKIEKFLFPAHVTPAFFFDGEQAEELIETAGEQGIRHAVEVLFGTKLLADVSSTLTRYANTARQSIGGKRKASEREQELADRLRERDEVNADIAKRQAERKRIEQAKEQDERRLEELHERFSRMGGASADARELQITYQEALSEQREAEKALAEVFRGLGLALGMKRLGLSIQRRLKAEEIREEWEVVKRQTLANRESVLDTALPEPPERDPLLGNIAPAVREKVRARFIEALERIYNPPKDGCAKEYLLGHIRGEARAKVLHHLASVFSVTGVRAKAAAKRLRDAREAVEEAKLALDRQQNLPEETQKISAELRQLSERTQEASRKLGSLDNEIEGLKGKHRALHATVMEIQEDLKRLGPEQERIAVAERTLQALEQIQEKLKPTTSARLERCVTAHFTAIADKRFSKAEIHLGPPPELRFPNGKPRMLLEMNSGFEKRAFGIAFTLTLADLTHRRLPLVIDTPLGNADSKYRLRTLNALAGFDLDQIIVLSHDEEVDADLAAHLKSHVGQTFLAEYVEDQELSIVHPNRYFKR